MIFFALAGVDTSYVLGASRMEAECSLWIGLVFYFLLDMIILTLQFLHRQTKCASPREPESSFCSYFKLETGLVGSRGALTKRLKLTQFGCVSRQDVHCTLKV